MRKNNLVYSSLLFTALSISTVNSVVAQETKPIINATLTGIVIDAETKEPLRGVTVQLDAVTHKVTTDNQGRFQFDWSKVTVFPQSFFSRIPI